MAEQAKGRGIGRGLRKFLWVGLVVLFNRAVARVTDEELQADLKLMIGKPLEDFKTVLTDNDPNDLDQVKTVWQSHKKEVFYNSIETLESGVRILVKDDNIKETILELLDAYQNEIKADLGNDIVVNFS